MIIDPDSDTINKYHNLSLEYEKRQMELTKQGNFPAKTKDGKSVILCANAGNLQDIKNAVQYHIDGVGLFRSEFLYMENTHFPTEEEQFLVYKEAALLCGKELTIRTLDIGGDKNLSYYQFEKEDNPFLGWRAIRISLELKDMFKTQLRAILRASTYGNIRIMFPMIISLEELRMAKEILKECQEELNNLNITWDHKIEVGMMIETPASVLLAEDFAKEVDFFSIGTNDLTQYMLAVDRGNKKISGMYNSFHPSVIRSIKKVIKAAHDNHIKAGMCGEFASDEKAVLLLLGLGLDEFSMAGKEIPNIKYIIRNSSYENAITLAENVSKKSTLKEVYEVLSILS
nr:phosphoenolpyruvate--protein phosphotransferase [Anaerocolumna sedimenticola]